MRGDTPAPATVDHRELWAQDARRWNDTWASALNAHRTSAGMPPAEDVRSHILAERPWLAADPTLAPWRDSTDPAVLQTGAWILPDDRPLSPELETFLEAGDPPVYFGFGSMRAPQDPGPGDDPSGPCARTPRDRLSRLGQPAPSATTPTAWPSTRRTNRRCSHAWPPSSTTAAPEPRPAALAGAPQVVIPQIYDQHYWAQRIGQLGIGTAHAPGAPTTDSLVGALGTH